MKDIIRIGVLGCGQIAQIMHLPYLAGLPGFEIRSVCDLSAQLAGRVGARYGVPAARCFTSYDAMLADDGLDAVAICSKDHCEPVLKAAATGKHIFVEKPFGFNPAEAAQMVEAVEKAGVVLLVGYMKRYDTGYLELLRRIKALEDISLVRIHDFGGSFAQTGQVFDLIRCDDIPPALLAQGKAQVNAAMLAGVEGQQELLAAYSLLLGVTSHDLVLLRHAFGNDPEVLHSSIWGGGFLTSVLRFGTVQCVVESSLVMARQIWDESFSVFSPAANLTLHFPWPYVKNAPSRLWASESREGLGYEGDILTSYEEPYRAQWQHFYRCVVKGETPLTGAADAAQDIRLAARIALAAQKK